MLCLFSHRLPLRRLAFPPPQEFLKQRVTLRLIGRCCGVFVGMLLRRPGVRGLMRLGGERRHRGRAAGRVEIAGWRCFRILEIVGRSGLRAACIGGGGLGCSRA